MTNVYAVLVLSEIEYGFKVWMVNAKNEAVFGDGLADLLEEIGKRHSIVEAAKHLCMSYRYALHRIVLAEKRLNKPLVNRSRGGSKGGGFSEVTDFGKELIFKYRNAQTELNKLLKTLPKPT
jgi:molybdate transport system regulatory protein